MDHIRKTSLSFAIDVSGQPYDTVIVGLIAYDKNHINRFRKDFNTEFPRFLSKKQKGSILKSHDLSRIIGFVDSHNIKMGVISFTTSDWERYIKQYRGMAFFKEKMYALLYFRLLKVFTYPKHNYQITLCSESYLNIERLQTTLRRLAKANRFDYDLSISSAKFNQNIKFADYVAAAYRKLPFNDFKMYGNYHIIRKDIPQRDLDKAFR